MILLLLLLGRLVLRACKRAAEKAADNKEYKPLDVQALEAEHVLLARLNAEGRAWRGVLGTVLSRLDAAIAAEAEAASMRLAQVQVGLALLRACFAVLGAIS